MMYNRYIPQPDGSYRKSRVPEPKRPTPPARHTPTPKSNPVPVQNITPPPCPPDGEHICRNHDKHSQPCRSQQHNSQDSLSGFFKQLLPKNIDTADLLIILLLLLMAGDCEEERNNALLTLALYFFM